MESFSDLLNLVKEHLKQTINMNDVAYNCWINPIQPIKFEDNTAYIFVKADFHKQFLEKQYIDKIKQAFNDIFGFEVNVIILTETTINSNISYPQPDNQYFTNIDSMIDSSDKKHQIEQTFQGANYEYTFETFIVGSSNNFAYAACKAVAQKQSKAYNPLFIYGPSGLGKTHLLSAISNELNKNYSDLNIIYVSGEAFTNELISAIQKQNTNAFHEKYRNADLLLIDDIQFIAGKESTQEEFFHTFNELHKVGKQIVLASDRPPKDIKTLEDRLKTRFEWGLLTDVSPPDFETRMAIIKRKAELLDIEVPNDVAQFIATKIKNNIRQLEGAVKKLKAYKILANSNPTINVAQNVVKEILNDNQPVTITVERIIEEVAKTYKVTSEDIRSKKRSAAISNARQIAIYVTREITQMSQKSIGEEFGGRDHATIVYALQQVIKEMKENEHTKNIVDDIIKNIQDN